MPQTATTGPALDPAHIPARIRPFFDAEFYRKANTDIPDDRIDPLTHYCTTGWLEGRDPSAVFSTVDYMADTPDYTADLGNPLLHFLSETPSGHPEITDNPGTGPRRLARTRDDRFVLVTLPGANDADLVAQEMDAAYYLDRYPHAARSGLSPALHYLTLGWVDGHDPSAGFSTAYYLRHNDDVRHAAVNPFLHYLKHGVADKWRPVGSVRDNETELRFETGPLARAVQAAIALDPMVGLPHGVTRRVTAPKPMGDAAARALRARFAGQSFDDIVLIPHVRMSGATRVAGQLTRALRDLGAPREGRDMAARGDGARILVVATDGSDMEHPEWFPEDVALLDFAALTETVSDRNIRQLLLLDLLRGTRARRLFNVNSRTFWDMLQVYGRQIAQEHHVTSYLFTWEETETGIRTGYPIQWLRHCIDHIDLLLCDSDHLAGHVRDRFALDDAATPRLAVLRSPVEPLPDADAEAATVQRPPAGAAPHILWAGRFDRQKRPDIVATLARRNPDWTFTVYGKPVLDTDAPPPFDGLDNVRTMGAYRDLREVLHHGAHLFLYTAQWDGIPTILLDVAQHGLPVVASAAGGIPEIIGPDTGWLIDPIDDIDAYEAAISSAAADPDAAAVRAGALRDRVAGMFAPRAYRDDLRKLLPPLDAVNR